MICLCSSTPASYQHGWSPCYDATALRRHNHAEPSNIGGWRTVFSSCSSTLPSRAPRMVRQIHHHPFHHVASELPARGFHHPFFASQSRPRLQKVVSYRSFSRTSFDMLPSGALSRVWWASWPLCRTNNFDVPPRVSQRRTC